MCDESAPVKALAFLQNEVSAVVDHDNPKEATIFRSLLSHLLAPKPEPSADSSTADPRSNGGSATPSSASSVGTTDGKWTNELPAPAPRADMDEDAVMLDAASEVLFSEARAEDDPYELTLRGGRPLAGTRFRQRTEVFESLLKFVEAEGKQPSGSLLDMLCEDEV